jgi:hypothetical protein
VAIAFDNKRIVTTNEIVITNLLEISTWIELLVEKVIVTEEELVIRIKELIGKIRGK